jgi:hypothetical protein
MLAERRAATILVIVGLCVPVFGIDLFWGMVAHVRGSASLTDAMLLAHPLATLIAVAANAVPFAILAAIRLFSEGRAVLVAAIVTGLFVVFSSAALLYDIEIAGESAFSYLALIIGPMFGSVIAVVVFGVANAITRRRMRLLSRHH